MLTCINRYYSIDAMVRKNACEWFRDYRYQSHMNGASLWEKLGRRRFRSRSDRDRILSLKEMGKKKSSEGEMRRERLDCCK